MTPPLKPVSHADFLGQIATLADLVRASGLRFDHIVGLGRGGLVPAVYLSHLIDIPMVSLDFSLNTRPSSAPVIAMLTGLLAAGERLLFVDDINDSGKTIALLRQALAKAGNAGERVHFATLFTNVTSSETMDFAAVTIDRSVFKDWLVFPWESVASEEKIVSDAGEVPERLG